MTVELVLAIVGIAIVLAILAEQTADWRWRGSAAHPRPRVRPIAWSRAALGRLAAAVATLGALLAGRLRGWPRRRGTSVMAHPIEEPPIGPVVSRPGRIVVSAGPARVGSITAAVDDKADSRASDERARRYRDLAGAVLVVAGLVVVVANLGSRVPPVGAVLGATGSPSASETAIDTFVAPTFAPGPTDSPTPQPVIPPEFTVPPPTRPGATQELTTVPTATPRTTPRPTPKPTPKPTPTLMPSGTPAPSDTPIPSDTPLPTDTPSPTP